MIGKSEGPIKKYFLLKSVKKQRMKIEIIAYLGLIEDNNMM
jgi:hypothetical protein